MMAMNKSTWILGGVAALSLSVSLVSLICSFGVGSSDSAEAGDARVLRSRVIREKGPRNATDGKRSAVRIKPQQIAVDSRKNPLGAMLNEAAETLDDEQLAELTQSVIRELQGTVERKDFPALQKLIAKIMSNPKSVLAMSTVPIAVRRAIVQALGSFGPAGLPELVEFLGDADPTVAGLAEQTFTMSLSDFSLGDYDRSPLIIAAAQILTEETAVTEVMMNLSSCRPSVIAATMAGILEKGTPEAQEAALKKMRFLAHDETISTVEDVRTWAENNPDPANAQKIFGGYGRNK